MKVGNLVKAAGNNQYGDVLGIVLSIKHNETLPPCWEVRWFWTWTPPTSTICWEWEDDLVIISEGAK